MRVFSYSGNHSSHMVMMLNFLPSMQAVWKAAMPGAITGMSSRERRAARPESLTVSMHTAL
ncbi:hypothetical protein D3C84_1214070 [compost metagenome]